MPALLRLGTRGSPLALAQAAEARRRLGEADAALAEVGAVETVVIRTGGDRLRTATLAEGGGKGLFTKEIEEALLDGRIDLAVHSLKDLPSALPAGLVLAGVLPRADARDALVSRGRFASLAELPSGAAVGTASLRRKALALHRRPDLRVVPFRGNVDTRLKRLAEGRADATLLAMAGLGRLGRVADTGAVALDPEVMLPAPCQGIIALEARADDAETRARVAALDHAPSAVAAAAERALLAALDASCRTPIAALAEPVGGRVALRACLIRPDGSEILAESGSAPAGDAARLGAEIGARLHGRAGPGFFDAG